MLHKLIESVTTTGAIATAIVFVVGYVLVNWFASRVKEDAEDEYPFDERNIY